MTYKKKDYTPYRKLLDRALLTMGNDTELSRTLALILFEAIAYHDEDNSLSSCIHASATVAREAEYELKTAGFYADIQKYPDDVKDPHMEQLRSIYIELINPKKVEEEEEGNE